MKKYISAAVLCLVCLAALLTVGCAPSNTTETPTQRPIVTSTPVTQYVCRFYQDASTLLKESTFNNGDMLSSVSFDIDDDEQYDYEFLGWDANGDGVPEEFPYTITQNTDFYAIIQATPIIYHYDIYVKGQKVSSVDAPYGETINYPDVQSGIEGNEVNFFLGWKYDGIFDGYTYNTVTKNVRIDAYFADSQILRIYYDNMFYAHYIQPGTKLTQLDQFVAPSGYAIKWYYDSDYNMPFSDTEMVSGNLTVYGRLESTYVKPATAVDVNSQAELLNQFNIMQINRIAKKEFSLNFSHGNVNKLTSYLVDNSIKMHNYKVNCTLQNDVLTVNMTYNSFANKKTNSTLYTQVASANLNPYPNKRGAGYNGFAVEKVEKTFEVTNSEALFYALENGYRPVISSKNSAVLSLYNKMKDVLRTAVTDEMTDTEKARAIYEYLAMEITYDGKLLELATDGKSNVEGYRGFVMEGVFEDKIAVCDGISKAYAALCNMEGIPCVRVTGATKSNTNHAWNKIKINGNWYVVDVTSAGSIVDAKEVFTYAYFMLTDSKYSEYATEDGEYHADIKCNTKYNAYADITFNGACINITSAAAGGELIKSYIDNAPDGISSFDFKLDYTYTSAKDALDAMLQSVSGVSVSYVTAFDSLTLIYTK